MAQRSIELMSGRSGARMPMQTVKLSSTVTVASQPDLKAFRDLASEGYVAMINNRPDGEDPTQPGSEAEEAAAEEAGLAYAHIPMGAAPLSESDVRHFQSVVGRRVGPGVRTLPQRYALGQSLGHRRSAGRPYGDRRSRTVEPADRSRPAWRRRLAAAAWRVGCGLIGRPMSSRSVRTFRFVHVSACHLSALIKTD